MVGQKRRTIDEQSNDELPRKKKIEKAKQQKRRTIDEQPNDELPRKNKKEANKKREGRMTNIRLTNDEHLSDE